MNKSFALIATLLALTNSLSFGAALDQPFILRSADFKHYVDSFNANDHELYPAYITNGAAWNFLEKNIPFFDCPDKDIEQTYYFRWWTYRKHIKLTPDGFILTEFLPDVPWAGQDNSINCAAGHHIYEGRWLADPQYLDGYSRFWFGTHANPRLYSTWLADALWSRYLVNGNPALPESLLPQLVENAQAWKKEHLRSSGLFWQTDNRDGMEMSISGDGLRPPLNSYMYADDLAIANIAALVGQTNLTREYRSQAAQLKQLVEQKLWNSSAQFFEVLSENGQSANVREELGYTPWYFNLPATNYSVAWSQLMDPKGFYAPFGPTTAEQRSPHFQVAYTGHECQWNGPSWPFATSITLTALANLLDNYPPTAVVTRQDYFNLLKIYTQSQHLKLANGQTVSWIDEDLDPYTGIWIARTLLQQRGSEIPERGKDYNHSTYCDLIITGLVGLRPRADNIVEVNPLVPPGTWDYFCLDNVHYHGHLLTILYDKTGRHYHHGRGLRLFADGKIIATARQLTHLTGPLPEINPTLYSSGGYTWSLGNFVVNGTNVIPASNITLHTAP